MMSGVLRLNKGFPRTGIPWLKLHGEAATGVPKRADRFVSQTAVFLAMCGIGLSMFCTRQLTEEPSTSSLVKRQK